MISAIIIILAIIILYFCIKKIITLILRKNKKIYCVLCNSYLPFIYSQCQEGCYNKKNLIMKKTPTKKIYKVIKENDTINKNNDCKLFRLGYIGKIITYFKVCCFGNNEYF